MCVCSMQREKERKHLCTRLRVRTQIESIIINLSLVCVSCFEAPLADIVVYSVCVCVQTESVHMCMFSYVSSTVYVLSYFLETHICEPAQINAVCVCGCEHVCRAHG